METRTLYILRDAHNDLRVRDAEDPAVGQTVAGIAFPAVTATQVMKEPRLRKQMAIVFAWGWEEGGPYPRVETLDAWIKPHVQIILDAGAQAQKQWQEQQTEE